LAVAEIREKTLTSEITIVILNVVQALSAIWWRRIFVFARDRWLDAVL
jgi:hypothetical protein